MNYIVGDVGNTTTRICLLNDRFKITRSIIFETERLFKKNYFKNLMQKFLKKKIYQKVLFSSVVPLGFSKIKIELKKVNYKAIEIKKLSLKKMIKINIKRINQLGSDRIANAIGGKVFKDCLIIDFGTATTFDIVKNGVYVGGVIAPGVKLSMMNLSKSTALLPTFKLKKKQKNFGKNTKDALNAGFIWGYEGLINNIINKIILKTNIKYKIILTGGYAKFFSKVIKKKSTVDQNITIRGISKFYKLII